MFTASISANGQIKSTPLTGISIDSTEYEYGNALYEAIRPYVEGWQKATVTVSSDGEIVHRLMVVPKGKGSILVTDNGLDAMPLSSHFRESKDILPEKYLVMVNPERNNNKFYRMVDLGNGEWGAYYGRVGEKQGESLYSNHVNKPYTYRHYMYSIKYHEKLAKGYKDVSDFHIQDARNPHSMPLEFSGINDRAVADLIQRLMEFADATVKENYMVKADSVTPAMVKAARESVSRLYKLCDEAAKVEAFNDCLLDLMHIIPRRIDGARDYGVKRMMASGPSDYRDIILREEQLLDIMEGQVKICADNSDPQKNADKPMTLLDAMGLEIYPARPDQEAQVLSHLDSALKPKLKTVFRVINKKSQERFNEYIRMNGGKRKVKVRQFWHGSRNQNWISILQNSLLLRPNAVITGKMFGNGIYFAPSPSKSWGYTSAKGTRWANGNSETAFMALFATAYGTPYEVFRYSGGWSGYDYNRLIREHPGCSCVHAKKGQGMLHEDEIIFYREDQMTINYICEFAA